MMAFCPEHPKWDQNPKFTPLSETTSIPTHFICGVPLAPGSTNAQFNYLQRCCFPYRTMFFLRSRCRHNFALAFCVVYSIRRSQSNETEPKINRSQSNPSNRPDCCSGSVIEHNRITRTFRWVRLIELVRSITELNRANRTQSTRLGRLCLAERQNVSSWIGKISL